MMWMIEKYLKYLVLFALLWGTLLGYTQFGCRKVVGRQMSPLMKDSEFVMVRLKQRSVEDLEVGCIVAYDYQVAGISETFRVGRVVGLPGDRIRFEAGRLFRNGAAVGEAYLSEGQSGRDVLEEITVPRDHLYILNDNRSMPPDSRTLGPIPVICLQGRINR